MKHNEKESSLLQTAIRAMFRPEEEKLKQTTRRGRKALSILMAAAMIFGAAGTASATDYTWDPADPTTWPTDGFNMNSASGSATLIVDDDDEADAITGAITKSQSTRRSVTKTGTGTATLDGNNSYDGGTFVDGGTLILNGNNTNYGSADINIGPITIPGVAGATINNGSTLVINGTNTGAGNTVLNEGTLVIGEFGTIGTGNLVLTDNDLEKRLQLERDFTSGRLRLSETTTVDVKKGNTLTIGSGTAVDFNITALSLTIESGAGINFVDGQYAFLDNDEYSGTLVIDGLGNNGNALSSSSSYSVLGGAFGSGLNVSYDIGASSFDFAINQTGIDIDFSGLEGMEISNNKAGGEIGASILGIPLFSMDLPGIGGGGGFMSAADINLKLGDNALFARNTATIGGNFALVSLDFDMNDPSTIDVRGKVSLVGGDNVSIELGDASGYNLGNLGSMIGTLVPGLTLPDVGFGVGGGSALIGTSSFFEMDDDFIMLWNKAGEASDWDKTDPTNPVRTTGNIGIGGGHLGIATDGVSVFKVGDRSTIIGNVATSVGGGGFLMSMGADENGKGGSYVILGDDGVISNNKATGAVNTGGIVGSVADVVVGLLGTSLDPSIQTVLDTVVDGVADALEGKGIGVGGGFALISTGTEQDSVIRLGTGNTIGDALGGGNIAGSDGVSPAFNPTGIEAIGIGGFATLISATGDAKVVSDGGNTYAENAAKYYGIGGAVAAISGTGNAEYKNTGFKGDTFQNNSAGTVGGAVALISGTGNALYDGHGTTTFDSNYALAVGGGLALVSGTGVANADFHKLVLTNNNTGGIGGGVAAVSLFSGDADNPNEFGWAQVTVNSLEATGNNADGFGGAIASAAGYGDAAIIVQGKTVLADNTSLGFGGGLAAAVGYGISDEWREFSDGNALVMLYGDAEMTGNSAVGFGGAVASTAIVGDASIGILGKFSASQNSAVGYGGVLAATSVYGDANVNILGVSELTENSATGLGGVIAATTVYGDATVQMAAIQSMSVNSAQGLGGVVASTAGYGDAKVIVNGLTDVQNNSAGGLGGVFAATALHGNAAVYLNGAVNAMNNTAGGLGGVAAATSAYSDSDVATIMAMSDKVLGNAVIDIDGIAHISGNTAGGLGGAFAATSGYGNAVININALSSFHHNTAGGLGGALAATAIVGDAAVYTKSLEGYTYNSADGLGGAIAATSLVGRAIVDIDGVAILSHNSAKGVGGAIAATTGDGLSLVNISGTAYLSDNTANGFGGAIASSSLLGNAEVHVEGDAKFVDNFAYGFGGAVAATAGDDALFCVGGNATFVDNSALGIGGAVSVIGEDNAAVQIDGKATFFNNEAVGVTILPILDDILGYGGGLAVVAGDGWATVHVEGEADFYANKANGMGGGAAVTSLWGTARAYFGDDATFRGNTADGFASFGGGLAVNGKDSAAATFNSLATIIDNHANAFGGGAAVNSEGFAGFFTNEGARVLRNTALGYGGGVAVNGKTAIISFGSDTLVQDNSAVGFGGGLAAFGADYARVEIGSDSRVLDNRATFDLILLGDGGGVWSSHDLFVGGNSLFSGNLAGGQGGAVYLAGHVADHGGSNSALLSTWDGDIAFTGNLQYVDFDKRGNAKGGVANAMYLNANTTLQITGSNNVFFDDQIDSSILGGNDFEMVRWLGAPSNGFVQLVGDNYLNRNGLGGSINVYDGTLRLAQGATFATYGWTSEFNLEGTIAGTGTIIARNQYLSGYMSPDADRFETPNGIGTAAAEASRTVVNDDQKFGILSFDGNAKLDGATFVVDISKNPVGTYPVDETDRHYAKYYSGKPIYATDHFRFTGDIEFVGDKSAAIIDGPEVPFDQNTYVHEVIISEVTDLSTGDVRTNLDEIFNDYSKALTWRWARYHDANDGSTLNFMDLGFHKSTIAAHVARNCYTQNKYAMAELVDALFATGEVDWLQDLVYDIDYADRALICDGVYALLGGEIVADAQAMALWSPWKRTNNRLYELYDNARRGCDPCGAINSCGSRASKWNAWFEGYLGTENVANDGNANGYDVSRGGMMFGADARLNSRFTLGATFGYATPQMCNGIGKIESDDYTFGLYSQARLTDKVYANLFLGYGHQDNDYNRYRMGKNSATYDSDSMYVSVEFFRPIHRKGATLFPLLAFDYQGVWTESFRERVPGGLGLAFGGSNYEQAMIRFGVNAKARWNDRLNLKGRLQYGGVIGGEARGEVNTAFAMNPGESRTLLGVNRGRHLLDAGVGAEFYVGPKKLTHFFVDYDIVVSENSTGHWGQVGVARTW